VAAITAEGQYKAGLKNWLQTIYLCRGARVMLRHNISVQHGLVNGTIGRVERIVYKQGNAPPAIPFAVLCTFDGYAGPTLSNGYVPVQKCNISAPGGPSGISNIPLTPAYALTIHKCQGQTLEKAHISLPSSHTHLGLLYVALSRVCCLSDLSLSFFLPDYFEGMRGHKHFQARLDFLNAISAFISNDD